MGPVTFNVRKVLLFFFVPFPRLQDFRSYLARISGSPSQCQGNNGGRGKNCLFFTGNGSPGTTPDGGGGGVYMRGIGTRQRNSENFFTSPPTSPPVRPSVPGVHFPRQPPPFVPLLRRRGRTYRDLPRLSTAVYTTYACTRVRETDSLFGLWSACMRNGGIRFLKTVGFFIRIRCGRSSPVLSTACRRARCTRTDQDNTNRARP